MLDEPSLTDEAAASHVKTAPRLLAHRYRLLSLIGSGASAQVFRAEDVTLGREVAVKILHPALAADAQFRRRFETEARHAAALNHPNLLAIYDWADSDQVHIVTELLAGGSLRDLLDEGHRFSASQALLVGLEAAQGLAHAHEQGFVHRDIKPANLLFDRAGRLSVADFGIARAVAEASWTEPDGSLIGTARYAAPEQALGRGVDGRADVYALALTLIESVTGEVPLVGANPLATMVLRQDHDIEVPAELGPLAAILARAGAADPERRPTSKEFIAQLEVAAAQLPRPAALPLAGLRTEPVPFDADFGSLPVVEGDKPVDGPEVVGPALRATVVATPIDPTTPMPRPVTDFDAESAPSDLAPDTHPSIDSAWSSDSAIPPSSPSDSTAPSDSNAPSEPTVSFLDSYERRRRWPWIMALLVALGAAAAIIYGTGAVDQILPDREPEIITYPVGTFVGRDVAEVGPEIAVNQWTSEISYTRSDGSVPGEILTQSPAPGVQLPEAGVVILVVSEGVLLHPTPTLVGLTVADAELALASENLVLGEVGRDFSEDVAEGVVLSAAVEPGVEVETGAAVDVLVSAGPEPRTIPNLVGQPRADAEATLAGLGLVAVVTEDFSRDVAEGLVISTAPGPDTTVERGGEVGIVISRGLPFVTVPNVIDMSAADAADALADAGLVVTDTNGPPNKEVLATDPQAGDSVRLGTGVIIFTKR